MPFVNCSAIPFCVAGSKSAHLSGKPPLTSAAPASHLLPSEKLLRLRLTAAAAASRRIGFAASTNLAPDDPIRPLYDSAGRLSLCLPWSTT
jgi:hypothetical protein